MKNKIRLNKPGQIVKLIFIILVTLGVFIFLLDQYSNYSFSKEMISLIMELSLIVAGFGLLGFSFNKKDTSRLWEIWYPDLRKITLSAIISLILGFMFFPLENNVTFNNLIGFCCIALFFYSIILFFAFLLFYDPNEAESKKG